MVPKTRLIISSLQLKILNVKEQKTFNMCRPIKYYIIWSSLLFLFYILAIIGCLPSFNNSLVSEGDPGLKLAVVVVEIVSLFKISTSLNSSLTIISSSIIFSKCTFPLTEFLIVGEWTVGNSSSRSPRSTSSRFIWRTRLCCLVVRQPVSASRSRRWPDLDLVNCVCTYSFRSSSSFFDITRLRHIRNIPRDVAKIPVATSSFHHPPSRQVITSSGSIPEAMRNKPRTKKTTPRCSMPMEVLSLWSGGADLEDFFGLWTSRLLWLVWGDEKRLSLSSFLFFSLAFLCRLMAKAEWRPTLPCICNPERGQSLHYIKFFFNYMHLKNNRTQHKLLKRSSSVSLFFCIC